jgi:imidazolonepropionase-like amidohydrolase
MTTVRSQQVLLDGELRPATLRIEDGVFAAVGGGSADHDFGDLVVMPGLVDSHVHVNEPGRTAWEGFATATRRRSRRDHDDRGHAAQLDTSHRGRPLTGREAGRSVGFGDLL